VVAADAVKALVAIFIKCILFDRVAVVMVMAVEVRGMAAQAGPAITTVDSCVPVAVGANNAGAVDTGVAGKAVIFMHGFHGAALMAGNAEGSGGALYAMVMAMARGVGR